MSKIYQSVIRTATQVFDITIQDEIYAGYMGDADVLGLRIYVRVGDDPGRGRGSQVLELRIPHDANLSLVLRDWADLIQQLPDAIMEYHL